MSVDFRSLHPLAAVAKRVLTLWPSQPGACLPQLSFPGLSEEIFGQFREVQLPLHTGTLLFLALCKQRLQNSHIHKLFNFQMLIKSLTPSAGSASATDKTLG